MFAAPTSLPRHLMPENSASEWSFCSRRALLGFFVCAACILAGLSFAATRVNHSNQVDGLLGLPLETKRVSVSTTGEQGNVRSESPVTSGDGRFVVFSTDASSLVTGDTNDSSDIFVHDRLLGETVRASVSAAGDEAAFGADGGSISRNGRYVVFYSGASNLAPGDTNGRTDVFRKDLTTGQVELVSLAADGSGVNSSALVFSTTHSISDDGRYVTYASRATNIVPGVTLPSAGNHIYVRDMESGATELVSVDNNGGPGTENAQTPSISGNGHVVCFETRSPLDPRDTNGLMSVYARNHVTDTTEWISTNNYWEPPNDHTWRPRANYDGSLIVFDSTATDLVPRDQGGISPDVFLRNLDTDRTEKVSISSTGAPPNAEAYRGSISSDGRFVAYWSGASNHVPGKETNIGDIYLHDRLLGFTELISTPAGGGFGSDTSQLAALSGDATAISFQSFADNLVPGDTNEVQDIFARQIGPSVGFKAPLNATVDGEELLIEGITRVTGALLQAAADPAGDVVAAEQSSGQIGDISSAEIVYRTNAAQEILFRVTFHDLPFPVLGVATPGTTYGVSFRVDGRRYEIRMNAAEDVAAYATFDLYECDPVDSACAPQKTTPGGFGTAGHRIDFTVSFGDVGAVVGSTISDLRAFAGVGGSPSGAIIVLDEISVPSAAIPAVEAAVALASAGTNVDDAQFMGAAPPSDGMLRATVSLGDILAGHYDVFARICIGSVCGYSAGDFTIWPMHLTGAASRKIHGPAGAFDVDLLSGNPAIESRTGGAAGNHQLTVTFAVPVTVSGASVTSESGHTAELDAEPISSADGKEVTVNLKNVSNAQTITVSLLGVSDGTLTDNVSLRMGVLLGDTNGNGAVNSSDISQTKSQSGQTVSASNFRQDVTVSGSINSSDISLVKSRSGTALP